MKYNKIIEKIRYHILKYGIPQYIKKWKPYKMVATYDNDMDFIYDLREYINSYHHHSHLYYKGNYIPTKAQIKEWSKVNVKEKKSRKFNLRRMPHFSFGKDKIGRIVFYDFYNQGDWKKDQENLVKLVHNNLEKWNKSKISGLILDFRNHSGGNVFPLYYAFSKILNNKTIYGWSNKKTTKKDKIWLNIVNQKLNIGQRYLDNGMNIDYPIAILIGRNTSSSGEFGAIIFYGRKMVRFFGENTNGMLSGNMIFSIDKDIELAITESLVETVDLTFHDDEIIYPDVYTNSPIKEAKKWIKSITNLIYL